jgi:hypothetical protein
MVLLVSPAAKVMLPLVASKSAALVGSAPMPATLQSRVWEALRLPLRVTTKSK